MDPQTSSVSAEAGASARPLILRVITRLNVGGPSVHVQLLAKGLRAYGYDTELVVGQTPPGEGEMPLADDVGVIHRCPSLGRELLASADLRAVWWCYRLFRRLRPDIVHTHQAKAGFVGRVAAWLAGVPIRVHTFHGHTLRGYFSDRQTRRIIRVERWLARRTSRLIAISPRIRDELVNEFRIAPADKFEVIPLGLDLEEFFHAERFGGMLRAQLGLSANVRLIGIVGRLAPIKNHEMFLRAARLIRNRRDDVHFAVIGDGELRGRLGAMAREFGLGGSVHFVGWQPRSPGIYADLDLLALTSNNEGTPVVVIEAMAAGRACVATNVGGVGDVIEDGVTGRLIPPDDAEAMAEACLGLLSDDVLRASIGTRARDSARRYEQGRLFEEMAELYDRLTPPPGSVAR